MQIKSQGGKGGQVLVIDLVSVGIRSGVIVCHSFVIHSEQIKWRHATTSMDGVAYSHTHIDSLAICYLCNKDLYSHTHIHVCVFYPCSYLF